MTVSDYRGNSNEHVKPAVRARQRIEHAGLSWVAHKSTAMGEREQTWAERLLHYDLRTRRLVPRLALR